ncbi:Ppx/GppA phosphatase family protein [Maricaulis sp. CAU 1757]
MADPTLSEPVPPVDLISDLNPEPRNIAVIDVGSNSVRMVHYRIEGRAIWPVFNEKVMAGLGKGVRETRRLNPEGVEIALRTMKRFQRLLDAKQVTERRVVATAAVRNAVDGPDFVERVRQHTGLSIEVLSGPDEAEYSALGVVAGIPDADGVMGDLGGSSLELTPIRSGRPEAGETLALGPQEMLNGDRLDVAALTPQIDARLADSALARADEAGRTFYAVGGAWRTLAHLAFARFGYPLHLVHEFELDARKVEELVRLAIRLSPASLQGTPGISNRRVATLPYAALLLRQVMQAGAFRRLVFSAHGLREGVLAHTFSDEVLELDPLLEGAEALSRPAAPRPDFGRALEAWLQPALSGLQPVFSEERDAVLVAAAARLTDMGARLHPDHRADLARDSVLYAPFAAVSHAERVFLAAAIHYRYSGKRAALEELDVLHLIDEDRHDRAQMLGMTLRMAAKLSGRSPPLLGRFRLEVTEYEVRLEVDEGLRDLYVERCVSLLGNLAGIIGRESVVRYV